MEMAAHKTCRGLVETAVTSNSKLQYYTKLAPTLRGKFHLDSIRTELNQNIVQKWH
jgi:hypothetical protein